MTVTVPPINNRIFDGALIESILIELVNSDMAFRFQKSANDWIELGDLLKSMNMAQQKI